MRIHLQSLLFATSILFSLSLSAQNADSTKSDKKRSRFSIGIVFSPDYCYRTLVSDNDFITTFILDSRNDREIPMLGFTAGINGTFDISKRFSVEIGVNYSNKGYQYDLSGLTFGDQIDPRYGFVYQTQSVTYTYKSLEHSYDYLDIPLQINFAIFGKRLQCITSAGIIGNVFMNAETITRKESADGDEVTDKVSDNGIYNSFGLSGSFSIGALYNISDKIRLSVMPVFRHSFTEIRSSYLQEYLWSAGVNVGGYYRF